MRVGVKLGAAGVINNSKPFVIGGVQSRDHVNRACDYYPGQIDY